MRGRPEKKPRALGLLWGKVGCTAARRVAHWRSRGFDVTFKNRNEGCLSYGRFSQMRKRLN